MTVKAVLTDLDGTLYRSKPYEAEIKRKTLEIISEKLGVTEDHAERRLMEARKACVTLTQAIELIGVSRHYFYEELSKRLNYSKFLKPDTRIKGLMDALHAMGLKVAIITNSGRPHALKTMEALQLPPESVDALITSSDTEPKTSPKPYLKALEALGVKASEAIYMGDRVEEEVKPAKLLGMKTILVSESKVESPYVDWVIDTPFRIIDLLKDLMSG